MKQAFLLSLLSSLVFPASSAEIPESLQIEPGTVNAITIQQGARKLAINRATGSHCDVLLLTHGRRDIVRAATQSPPSKLYGGELTVQTLAGAEAFWNDWWEDRFDYYQQQVPQVPVHDFGQVMPFPDTSLSWEGLNIRMLPTPGYTRDGVTYLTELEGKRIAFVGDLLLAGGKIRDLYSFQNEIPEARIGGYHGHLGRLHVWLTSLTALLDEEPDLLVPSRGPVSFDPAGDIQKAIQKSRAIYANYLSTNALHWYFGEERMNTCAELVLGANHDVSGMPLAEHVDLPEWCRHIGTTKLLVSESGKGFALDVGGTRSLETLQQIEADGLISKLEGIFATHAHNDHTAAIADAAAHFHCPVYALPEVADVLTNPGHWFLPGVSPHRVDEVREVADRETMKWEEFTFTFFFYPGQMYNHGALLVEKSGHAPVFFIGDSFSPSGIDDYCMMNRNLMRKDTGYEFCFRILGELPEDTWLVNQHIPHLFRFSANEKAFLLSRYRERADLIGELVPWDDVNYAIDPQWASFYPYGAEASPGDTITTAVRIWNHSVVDREFQVTLRHPDLPLPPTSSVRIPARTNGIVSFEIALPREKDRFYVITADILRDDAAVAEDFCETLIRVGSPDTAEQPDSPARQAGQ